LTLLVGINGVPPEGDDVAWQRWCPGGPTVGRFNPYRWVPAGEDVAAEAPSPTAEDVALMLRESVEGRVPEPVVVTSPPVGVDAVVGVPVFVEVTNWVDEL